MKEHIRYKEYYRQRVLAIRNLLEKESQKWKPEDFHKLRVEIKKLRAVISLISTATGQKKRKSTKSVLTDVFRKAGKVRELQIRDETLKTYGLRKSKHSYRAFLANEIRFRKKRFFNLMNKKLFRRLEKETKKDLAALETVTLSHVEKHFLSLVKRMNRIMQDNHVAEHLLHDLRKILKEYLYLLNITSKDKARLQRLNAFQELLGLWHDNEVIAGDLLAAIESGKLTATELQEIRKIQRSIISRNKKLYSRIVSECNRGVV